MFPCSFEQTFFASDSRAMTALPPEWTMNIIYNEELGQERTKEVLNHPVGVPVLPGVKLRKWS